jgi:hypothetical protein
VTVVPQSRTFDVLGLGLEGDVAVPENATGLVLMLRIPDADDDVDRDVRVAEALNGAGIATVRIALLTPAEQQIDAATAELRFNADLLGVRTIAIIDLLATERGTARLHGGVLASHSAVAAALIAAAARPLWVRAIASACGRPDLAGEFLYLALAPTLLVVGEYDTELREQNEDAADRIAGPARVAVLDGVGPRFDQDETRSLIADMFRDWFREHLRPRTAQHARARS